MMKVRLKVMAFGIHVRAHIEWQMPPRIYSALHPEAKLTEENKKAVCARGKEQTTAAR
jgi:hypothetical protein